MFKLIIIIIIFNILLSVSLKNTIIMNNNQKQNSISPITNNNDYNKLFAIDYTKMNDKCFEQKIIENLVQLLVGDLSFENLFISYEINLEQRFVEFEFHKQENKKKLCSNNIDDYNYEKNCYDCSNCECLVEKKLYSTEFLRAFVNIVMIHLLKEYKPMFYSYDENKIYFFVISNYGKDVLLYLLNIKTFQIEKQPLLIADYGNFNFEHGYAKLIINLNDFEICNN